MAQERLWIVALQESSVWVVRSRSEGGAIVKAVNGDGLLLTSHIHDATVEEIREMRG